MSLAFVSFGQERPIVLVELFTSEGCSSCPPADKLLSSIVSEEYDNAEVIGLSFHVDYWNYIGWKDPYSDARFSKRQRNYARQLASSVYTPQMVVNGTHQFVGSSKSNWKTTLNEEVKRSYVQPLKISSARLDGKTLNVEVESVGRGAMLNLAVVERELSQNVNRGENRGRILFHDNVVRSFQSQYVTGASTFKLMVPDDLNLAKSSLVVYTQDQDDLKIQGVKKIELSSL